MSLDVETPNPPDLTNRPLPSALEPEDVVDDIGDVRRAELEEILLDGAWSEAFQEWAEYTDLSEAEYRTLLDAGLVDGLDFYWDPMAGRIDVAVPTVPDDVVPRTADVSRLRSELSGLGETVVEMIEDAYVDWGTTGGAEEPWTEATFADDEMPSEEG